MDKMNLEEALLSELQKDVKLKGGQTAIDAETGEPMKVFDAIAKSLVNNAMKGDIAAVNYIRNLTRQVDAEAETKRQAEAEKRVAAHMAEMRKELETDGLWIGQTLEVEQLAQDLLVIDNLNAQMNAEGYSDTLQEFKKDGSVVVRINPIHEWRDKYKKQFLSDWKELRLDSQRRIINQNKRKR